MPPWSSLSLSTKPGGISKFAGTPARAECLDEISRPWTAITATRVEMNAQTIVRTGAAFHIVERDKPWHFRLDAASALPGRQQCR
jgi:hypothetical protein